MKFEQNQGQNSFDIEGSPFGFFRDRNFPNRSASRCENIIKGGLNLNFHMVIKVAIQPQYLAALTAVLSTVGGALWPGLI